MLEKNGLTDAILRPICVRGSENCRFPAATTGARRDRGLIWPSYSVEEKLKGIRLEWSQWKRPSPETIPLHGEGRRASI